MSFIVKGIDLPERKDVMHHEKYIIHIYDDGEIYVGKELYDADNRLKGKEKYTKLIINGVQAIQIPKDHGRIGDLDELAQKCSPPNWCVWLSEIEDAPALLEAEDEQ